MPKRKYRAKNTIDYVSTNTGLHAHVEPGDVFDDMNSVGVRNELEHGNIEIAEDGENK
jgi:hypothetical protein